MSKLRANALGNLERDGEARVQSGNGILVDILDSPSLDAKGMAVPCLNGVPIEFSRAGSRRVESCENPPERGLSRARLAHESKNFAALNRKVDAVQGHGWSPPPAVLKDPANGDDPDQRVRGQDFGAIPLS
jgi:hypothetical protein